MRSFIVATGVNFLPFITRIGSSEDPAAALPRTDCSSCSAHFALSSATVSADDSEWPHTPRATRKFHIRENKSISSCTAYSIHTVLLDGSSIGRENEGGASVKEGRAKALPQTSNSSGPTTFRRTIRRRIAECAASLKFVPAGIVPRGTTGASLTQVQYCTVRARGLPSKHRYRIADRYSVLYLTSHQTSRSC
jgi:hypothetical protein